ncbi:MAG: ATP-dependent DNA helicase RecG [Oscillospiraceae bacterium]|nr:ATP-dependent DNA helicase RecG [Oscillospiraceae bacterium]
MPELHSDIRYIKGVGEQRAKSLARLGIHTLGDLLNYFPRSYEDRTVERPIAEVLPEETACIRAMVATEPRLTHVRRGMDLVKLRIVDDSGSAELTYFNQSYVRDQLVKGETYVFYGKMGGSLLRKTMANPVYERADRAGVTTGRILPIYRLTHGISNKLLITAEESALEACGDMLPELLPGRITARYALPKAGYAYRNVHFPPDWETLALARRRLIFEELFVLSCAMHLLRGRREKAPGRAVKIPDAEKFYSSLPFAPTGAQRRAVTEALSDMASGKCMSRLVQGDVGSGKTLVAAALLWAAAENGLQSAFMAPTEILAKQHFATLTGFLEPLGLRVGLLTGSMTARQKREVKAAAGGGVLDVVVGTHALITEDVGFHDLGLVVTDEQHRFGVEQRGALTAKGDRPHVLVMSATPIPRTLALMIYGDLDVSILDELPPGRQKVDTVSVTEDYRDRLNGFIRAQVGEGRQVFVVCPMVEESEALDPAVKSATEHAETLRRTFPELTVGCVHGKMKPKEKDAAMDAFVRGETDILVSTTVVEVGVDVPNASLMIVENAERFGLSQLHQLRGRVGRGVHKSWCVLMAHDPTEEAKQRLRVLVKTSDGFAVAEEDLKLRGPGDFFGSRQHGLPEMHIAELTGSMDTLKEAQEAAKSVIERDPELTDPELTPLREHIARLFELNENTWN